MNSQTLADLIQRRWSLLQQLVDAGQRQKVAIEHGRMSELIAILNHKQAPLEQLQQVSQQLRDAIGDDPDSRHWESSAARAACHDQHEACEQMLSTLMVQEAECEAALTASRNTMEQQLSHSEGARRAASGYAASTAVEPEGRRLDLFSN